VLRPHGLKGALTVYSHTRPAIGIAGYSFWWLGDAPDALRRVAVRRCWSHGKRILAELDGVADVDAAEALAGLSIWIPAGMVECDDDEYLWADLIGCEAVEADGASLGCVVALEDYGAQDILIVRQEAGPRAGTWMLPFVHDVVREVDLDARRIVVHLPEGMDACFTPAS